MRSCLKFGLKFSLASASVTAALLALASNASQPSQLGTAEVLDISAPLSWSSGRRDGGPWVAYKSFPCVYFLLVI